MSNTASASLTVTIPAHLDAFIKDREERERVRDAVIDEIRRHIELGIQQAEAGQVRDGEEDFRDVRRTLGMA